MIRSMTGFARSERRGEFGALIWELRSVNHRYLEITLRLPDECRALEPELRQHLKERLARGKVEGQLRLEAAVAQGRGVVDAALVRELAGAMETVAKALPQTAPVSPLEVLRWPGVLQAGGIDTDSLRPEIAAGLAMATAQLIEARAREGGALADTVRQRCQAMRALLPATRERVPAALAQYRERLRAKLDALNVEADPARLEQELALLAQKLDVDEELDRLDTHLQEVERTLGTAEPVGRRLDFLMQELNREVNTISSKSSDLELTQTTVELKVLIEQMREQVQNIE